ncbi:hypothetical protein [Acidovorax sp. LjRoot117]|uniref:hypothetical protein n=1 Tax=Acidovorax sp. LjRoot117 TaxID=3342255 RepID=UPI003ECF643D
MKRLMFVHSLLNALRAQVLQRVWQWSQRYGALRAPARVPSRVPASQRDNARRRYRYRD